MAAASSREHSGPRRRHTKRQGNGENFNAPNTSRAASDDEVVAEPLERTSYILPSKTRNVEDVVSARGLMQVQLPFKNSFSGLE